MKGRFATLLVAGALLATATPSPAFAETQPERVYSMAFAGPCVPTTAAVVNATLDECSGNAVLAGTWTGVLEYEASGTIDLITGDASGSITETWSGVAGAAEQGGLQLVGTFTVDGATGTGVAHLQIVMGWGAFSNATGSVDAIAMMPLTGGPEFAQYTGSWRPHG